jgi:hypothetical protein
LTQVLFDWCRASPDQDELWVARWSISHEGSERVKRDVGPFHGDQSANVKQDKAEWPFDAKA